MRITPASACSVSIREARPAGVAVSPRLVIQPFRPVSGFPRDLDSIPPAQAFEAVRQRQTSSLSSRVQSLPECAKPPAIANYKVFPDDAFALFHHAAALLSTRLAA